MGNINKLATFIGDNLNLIILLCLLCTRGVIDFGFLTIPANYDIGVTVLTPVFAILWKIESVKNLIVDNKRLVHHKDCTVGLWAMDRPELIPDDIKHLFFEIKY